MTANRLAITIATVIVGLTCAPCELRWRPYAPRWADPYFSVGAGCVQWRTGGSAYGDVEVRRGRFLSVELVLAGLWVPDRWWQYCIPRIIRVPSPCTIAAFPPAAAHGPPSFVKVQHDGVGVSYVLYLPALILLGWTALMWWRAFKNQDEGRCACGYDLTGNVSGVCPECGAAQSTRSGTGWHGRGRDA